MGSLQQGRYRPFPTLGPWLGRHLSLHLLGPVLDQPHPMPFLRTTPGLPIHHLPPGITPLYPHHLLGAVLAYCILLSGATGLSPALPALVDPIAGMSSPQSRAWWYLHPPACPSPTRTPTHTSRVRVLLQLPLGSHMAALTEALATAQHSSKASTAPQHQFHHSQVAATLGRLPPIRARALGLGGYPTQMFQTGAGSVQ